MNFLRIRLITICCLLIGFIGNAQYFQDKDNDGYGAGPGYRQPDQSWAHWATNNQDCDDNRSYVYPGALETCDGRDNNCNGSIDESPKPAQPPMPTITNNCGNTKLTRGTPPSGITWYWQNDLFGTSTSNSSSVLTLTSGTKYYLRGRNNSTRCWGTPRTINYTVKQVPGTPSAPSVTNYCGSTRLTRGTPPSGVTWYWQSSSSGTSTSYSSSYITKTTGTRYYLRARNNTSGCWSGSRTINYTVKAAAQVPAAVSVDNRCGSSVLTRSTPPSGVTWYWQSSSGGTSTSNNSSSITRTSGSTYYLRARNNSSGCWSNARTVSYSIKPVPFTPTPPSVVNQCGKSILTRSTPPSGVTWYWQSSSSGTSTANSSSNLTVTSGSTVYLRARHNSSGCWGLSRSVSYLIKPLPSTPAAPGVSNQCGQSVLTRSTPPSGITWYWQSSSTGTSTSNSSSSITRTSGSTYYLRARNNSTGCWSTTRTVSYNINVAPSTPATPSVNNQCGQSVLTRSTPPSGVTWYWQSSSGGTSTSNSNSSITRTSGSVYYLRARNNSSGCWSSSRSVSYSIQTPPTWYQDADSDGWGNPSVTKQQCTQPSGYVSNNLDHDDTTDTITNIPPITYYRDADNDGFGTTSPSVLASVQPTGYVDNALDQCPDEAGNYSGCISRPYQDIQLSNENYVFTRTYQREMSSPSEVTYNADVIEGVTYFDGLGRAKQQIGIKAAGISQVIPNNILPMDWTEGSGGTPFYNQNGATQENSRIQGVNPKGERSLLWHCGSDETRDADGGWNTDYFNVDKNIGYRYTVWVKRTGSQNGTTYHGTQNVNNLNGEANNNPYFWASDLPQLDTWYLLVGVIHPYQYNGSNTGISGVYDVNGNKVLNGDDFKWRDNTTTSRFRSYLYYSTDVGTHQYFWSPVVQKLDGTETSLSNIIRNVNPRPEDIVTHMEYDRYGRQEKEYLPFVSGDNSGSYNVVDATADIQGYYQKKYADDFPGITNLSEINAYSESHFEDSPLNRVLEQGAPGKDWKVNRDTDTDHTIKFEWDTNKANEVVYFTVGFTSDNTEAPILEQDGFYGIDQLHKIITKDENWQPGQTHTKDHTTEEFTDKQGRVILKRTFNNGISHDTYYVYDDFGNLTYVIPPKVSIDNGVSTTELSELCYQYKYDNRNRAFAKKVPGKEWEYLVYNKLDQIVLSQDGNLRVNNHWLFTKYDALSRVAYTGKITITGKTREQLQTEVNSFTSPLWVERSDAVMIGGVEMYYNNGGYPNTQNAEVLTINYYDDYDLPTVVNIHPGTTNLTWEGMTAVPEAKGLQTVSQVKVLETDKWVNTINYYDEKGRHWETLVENKYLNISDWVLNKLDFSGKVLKSLKKHIKDGKILCVTDTFTYDHMGRVLTQKQKIDEFDEEIIAENSYDELGQLQAKTVGGGLQQVDYSYTIRGWLKGINDVNNIGNDLFTFKVNYNNPQNGATALYNGNISETLWKTANDDQLRYYRYGYDALNRITGAISNDNRYNLSNVTYDKMGNILTLQRGGHLNEAATSFGVMDNLTYSYYSASNKLKAVAETVPQPFGFTKNATTGVDYNYDRNGNMITDRNKGITGVTYNHLNLPTDVIVSNSETSGNISYIYTATGAKLKKIATEGSSVTTTEYAGNYTYKNGNLEFFNHTEGYVEPQNEGSFKYIYQYTDIWNNVRISYADNDRDDKIDVIRNNIDIDGDGDLVNEIREESNYYPFGLKHQGYNNTVRGRKHNYETYQDQEFTEELGLNVHEWKYRISDPTIGRFWQIDPLAEDYLYNGTYNFAENKLGSGIELEGLEVTSFDLRQTRREKAVLRGEMTKEQFMAENKAEAQGALFGLSLITPDPSDIVIGVAIARAFGWFSKGKKVVTVAEKAVDKAKDIAIDAKKLEERAAKLNKVDRSGKDFTKAGKEVVIDQNKLKNNGKTICENCKVETVPAKKSERGVTPPKNETQVDHINPKSKGGRGNPDNGQVLCRGCNREKSDKVPNGS